MELKIKYYFIHHAYLNLLLLLNHFSCVQLCATLWTAAHQAPLFSRQEYWGGFPFPSIESLAMNEIYVYGLHR